MHIPILGTLVSKCGNSLMEGIRKSDLVILRNRNEANFLTNLFLLNFWCLMKTVMVHLLAR